MSPFINRAPSDSPAGPLSSGPAPFPRALSQELADLARALSRWTRSFFGLRQPCLLKLSELASSDPERFAKRARNGSPAVLEAAWSIAIGHLPLCNEAPLIALLLSGAPLCLPARSATPLGSDTPYFGLPAVTLEAFLGEPDASQRLHRAFAGVALGRQDYSDSFFEPLKSLCRLKDPLGALEHRQTRLNALAYFDALGSRVKRGFGLNRADAHLALALSQAPAIDRLAQAGLFNNPAWLARDPSHPERSLGSQVFKMSFHQRECQESPRALANWSAMASALLETGAVSEDELARALADPLLSAYRPPRPPGHPLSDPLFHFAFAFFEGKALPEPLLAVSELVALHESREFERALAPAPPPRSARASRAL